MAHESFADPEVAEILNRSFVPVKVDREERPDVDAVYMAACQAMTGQGGWPLTLLLTPNQKPFFAGTYFPKQRQFGRMGLLDLLTSTEKRWATDRDKFERAGESLLTALQRGFEKNMAHPSDATVVDRAYAQLAERFDSQYGGFGDAPKFPSPHQLLFLLQYGASLGESQEKSKGKSAAVSMVLQTLSGMYRGGIYDHVGFGFARYSTDRSWLVPHFEKMLYDNALLAYTYTLAYQATGEPWLGTVAKDILAYVLRDLRDPQGGFYAAEDADSEGEEGKFYRWSARQVKEVLGDVEGDLYCRCYGIGTNAYALGDEISHLATPPAGEDIPNLVAHTLEQFAESEGIDPEAWRLRVLQANHKLRMAREKRVRPQRDEKILTGWNAWMVVALAQAAAAFDQPDYLQAARRTVNFLENQLVSQGRLLARFCDGEAAYPAYAQDYANLVWAYLELYQADFQAADLGRALHWQKAMDHLFWDDEAGGYYVYGADAEQLVMRPKESYDGATPAANSVAAWNLLHLARLTADGDWEQRALAVFRSLDAAMVQAPAGFTFLLKAWLFGRYASQEIVVVATPQDVQLGPALRWLRQTYLPHAVRLWVPATTPSQMAEYAPFTAAYSMKNGQLTFYVCENYACQQPVTSLDEARQILHQT
ncbi:thioredoxin domain-containing protein [Alicyclobacillaceae bacterium I2511]|nr:thioredoxin domain-containing protein [Alicyclobacillaceae bacterium I2511]